MQKRHIAICMANLGIGGAQRAMITLAPHLVAQGWTVDFMVFSSKGTYRTDVPDNSKIHVLGTALPLQLARLKSYTKANPDVPILATQAKVTRVVALGKRLGLVSAPLVFREANRLAIPKKDLRSRLWRPFLPWLYKVASGFITLSVAGRDDLAALIHKPASSIPLIPNAVDLPLLTEKAQAPITHPWFAKDRPCPVILGAGRLAEQKGFDTLVDGVAELRKSRRVRLMILGQGPLDDALKSRAQAAGFGDDFALPGFQDNPYPFMKQADVFALSSRWEGSPNVLLEAMATGTAVAACDCPSGPREVLVSDSLGPLVPVDDADALAKALERLLDAPGDADARIAHIKENHGVDQWARAYEAAIEEAIA